MRGIINGTCKMDNAEWTMFKGITKIPPFVGISSTKTSGFALSQCH